MKLYISLLIIFFSIQNAWINAASRLMLVKAPVTNLRITAHDISPQLLSPALSQDMGGKETGQISQCLFNEVIDIVDDTTDQDWVLVNAQEQINAFGGPIPYGYLKKEDVIEINHTPYFTLIVNTPYVSIDALDKESEKEFRTFTIPLGTQLEGININADDPNFWDISLLGHYKARIHKDNVFVIDELKTLSLTTKKTLLVEIAHLFLDTKFVWGGRSINLPETTTQVTGVDNSGFINLIHRVLGITVPKNSRHQFLKAASSFIEYGSMVEPGDLIFLVKPTGVVSPMLYVGNDEVMYATGNPTGEDYDTKELYALDVQEELKVHKKPLSNFIKTPLSQLASGQCPEWTDTTRYPQGSTVYFGSFLY